MSTVVEASLEDISIAIVDVEIRIIKPNAKPIVDEVTKIFHHQGDAR